MVESIEDRDRTVFTLGELAKLVAAELKGDAGTRVMGVASLEDAGPGHVSFVAQARYAPLAATTRAGALIVDGTHADLQRPLLVSRNPYLTFARVAQLFAESPGLPVGVDPSAQIGVGTSLGEDVAVGPLACVGSQCTIGPRAKIFGGVYIGDKVSMGADCVIYPRAVILDRCQLGQRVIVHCGAVVGSDGFGFAQDEQGHHVKIPQMGTVQIDDDVEIGANCTIDRASLGKTWIGKGSKIDNQVQIGHNVTVGKHCILVAQVGISGSTELGNHVMLAGQTGVKGHIKIGDRVRVGAKSGVGHAVKPDEDMFGIPAMPIKEWMRTYGNMRRLPLIRNQLRELAEKVKALEQALQGNGDD